MKSPAIPETVDPTKSCDKKLLYNGVVSVGNLPRFLAIQSGETDPTTGLVTVKFTFRRDEQRLKIADMTFCAVAKLTCQRCLKIMESKCEGATTFVFCKSNSEIEQAPNDYEPVLVKASEISLWRILEDELLLSLPMIANHEDVKCNEVLNRLKTAPEDQVSVSPFAGLGELLKK